MLRVALIGTTVGLTAVGLVLLIPVITTSKREQAAKELSSVKLDAIGQDVIVEMVEDDRPIGAGSVWLVALAADMWDRDRKSVV